MFIKLIFDTSSDPQKMKTPQNLVQYIYLYYKQMRSIRKQLNQLSIIAEVILQSRMNTSEGSGKKINQVLKKMNQMCQTKSFNSAIVQTLIDQEQYGLKKKLYQIVDQQNPNKSQTICLELQLLVIDTNLQELFNSQTWQFQLKIGQFEEDQSDQKEKVHAFREQALTEVLKFIINNIRCFHLFPRDAVTVKNVRNRYKLKTNINISQRFQNSLKNFQNISTKQLQISKMIKLTSSYLYNNSKNEEYFKLFLKQKYPEHFYDSKGSSRKGSSTSTQRTREVSLYEHYDSDLDITILSNSDHGDEQYQQIVIQSIEQKDEEDEFQILIQDTQSDDQKFLKENAQLFRQFDILGQQNGLVY